MHHKKLLFLGDGDFLKGQEGLNQNVSKLPEIRGALPLPLPRSYSL